MTVVILHYVETQTELNIKSYLRQGFMELYLSVSNTFMLDNKQEMQL